MKKFLLFSCTIFFVAGCSDQPSLTDNPPNLRTLSAAEEMVAASGNDFAFKLFKLENKDKNTFISPLSVGIALGMVLNGASPQTQESIINTIDFSGYTASEVNQAFKDLTKLLLTMDREVKLGIANSVWSDSDYIVKQDFSKVIQNFYDGTVQSLDFSAPATAGIINRWVDSKTNGRIKELIGQISPDEIMFLINAIYFKGTWKYQFDKSKTHKAPFIKKDGTITQVNMMFSKGATLSYFADNEKQVLDIPYGNGQFNMTIIIPTNSNKFTEFANTITNSQFNSWLAQSDTLTTELEIPKFKMTWKNDLKNSLGEMGMKMYDFPALFEKDLSLEISRVIHQSFIEVNEEGTEAAAATAIGIEVTSMPSKPLRITVDKPFLFFIREKHANAILFMGQLLNPEDIAQ